MPIIKNEFDLVVFIVLTVLLQYCAFKLMLAAIDTEKPYSKTFRVFLKISIVLTAIPFVGLAYVLPFILLWLLGKLVLFLLRFCFSETVKDLRKVWNKL